MARCLIPEASTADAFGIREPRDKPALDQPTSGISRFITEIDNPGAHRKKFFFHIALEQIEGLV